MVAVVTSVQRLIRRKKKERSIRWINGRVCPRLELID